VASGEATGPEAPTDGQGQPPPPASTAIRPGADPREPSSPVDPGPHDLLLWTLTITLLARGAWSLLDAWSVNSTGARLIQADASASLSAPSVGWSVGWGLVALVAGLLFMRRHALAWLLALASGIAYLVTGIGEAAQITSSAGATVGLGPSTLTPALWALFLVDLAVPAILLALLFTVRPWFLAISRTRPR
jgi:hypothetical protein